MSIADLQSPSDQAGASGTAPGSLDLGSIRDERSDAGTASDDEPHWYAEEPTTVSLIGESTQELSSDPAGSPHTEPYWSANVLTTASLMVESTQEPPSVPAEDPPTDSQPSARERAQGSLTGESSSAPAGDTSSVMAVIPQGITERRHTRMSISGIRSSRGQDEDFQWIQIHVTSNGVMTEEEVKEALREKLQEMFDDPDPQIERVFSEDES
ncbi:uncharacterized protein LOC129693940 [Leucoraja erinacea]|uniref:uncharacterized protein LOC129693940 n=1 Tax=Leucoraja erinaceus TaxID=7782 RepID=UPI0024584243|nr:uncharacterized protein LOC129693940 [Leucoraja erinacea]